MLLRNKNIEKHKNLLYFLFSAEEVIKPLTSVKFQWVFFVSCVLRFRFQRGQKCCARDISMTILLSFLILLFMLVNYRMHFKLWKLWVAKFSFFSLHHAHHRVTKSEWARMKRKAAVNERDVSKRDMKKIRKTILPTIFMLIKYSKMIR